MSNSSLTDLNLAYNTVSDASQAFGVSLEHNSTLVRLNLDSNNIHFEGAVVMAHMLKVSLNL